jgi:hypothetical protein
MVPLVLGFMRESQAEMREFMRQQAEDNRRLIETMAQGQGQSGGRAARFMELADNMMESALTTSIAAIHKVQERVLGGAADELSHAVGGVPGKTRKSLSPNQVLQQAIEEEKERKRLLRDGVKAGVVPVEVIEEEEVEEEDDEEEDAWDGEPPLVGEAESEVAQPDQSDTFTRFANGVKAVAEAVPAMVRGYQQTMSLIRNPGSALNTMAESLEGEAGGGQS